MAFLIAVALGERDRGQTQAFHRPLVGLMAKGHEAHPASAPMVPMARMRKQVPPSQLEVPVQNQRNEKNMPSEFKPPPTAIAKKHASDPEPMSPESLRRNRTPAKP